MKRRREMKEKNGEKRNRGEYNLAPFSCGHVATGGVLKEGKNGRSFF